MFSVGDNLKKSKFLWFMLRKFNFAKFVDIAFVIKGVYLFPPSQVY